jgi:hypothetical protein
MSGPKSKEPTAATHVGVAKRDYLRDLKQIAKAPADDAMTPHIARLEPFQVFEIERMASQGLNLETIAARLGIDLDTWNKMIQVNPEIASAYKTGAALGQDIVSKAGLQGARNGDASLIKYYLDRFGGPQFRPQQQGPAVVIQTGPMVQIDQEAMARRFERQRALIDGTCDELEPDGPQLDSGPS